jgi:hypothetical protein
MHLNIVIYFLLIFCAVLEAQQPPFYSNIYAWLWTGNVSSDPTNVLNWQCISYSDPNDPLCVQHPTPSQYNSPGDYVLWSLCGHARNNITIEYETILWPTSDIQIIDCANIILYDFGFLSLQGLAIPFAVNLTGVTSTTGQAGIYFTESMGNVFPFDPMIVDLSASFGSFEFQSAFVDIGNLIGVDPGSVLFRFLGAGYSYSEVTTITTQTSEHLWQFMQPANGAIFVWSWSVTKNGPATWRVACVYSTDVIEFDIGGTTTINDGTWQFDYCNIVYTTNKVLSGAVVNISPTGALTLAGPWVFQNASIVTGGTINVNTLAPFATSFLGTVNNSTIVLASGVGRVRVDGTFNNVNIISNSNVTMARTLPTLPSLQIQSFSMSAGTTATFEYGNFQINGALNGDVILSSAQVTLAGTTSGVQSFTLDSASTLIFDSVAITSLPPIYGSGALVFNAGTFTVTDANILNAASITINGAVINWQRTQNPNLILPLTINSGQFVNLGTVTLSSNGISVNGPNAQFINQGTLNVVANCSVTLLPGAQFVNSGGTLNVNANFVVGTLGANSTYFINNNTGTVNISSSGALTTDVVQQTNATTTSILSIGGPLSATSVDSESSNRVIPIADTFVSTSFVNGGQNYIAGVGMTGVWHLTNGDFQQTSTGSTFVDVLSVGTSSTDVNADSFVIENGNLLLDGIFYADFSQIPDPVQDNFPSTFWWPIINYTGIRIGSASAALISLPEWNAKLCYDDSNNRVIFVVYDGTGHGNFEPLPTICKSAPPPPPTPVVPPPQTPVAPPVTPPPIAPVTPPFTPPPMTPPIPPRAPTKKKNDGHIAAPSLQLCSAVVLLSVTIAAFGRRQLM